MFITRIQLEKIKRETEQKTAQEIYKERIMEELQEKVCDLENEIDELRAEVYAQKAKGSSFPDIRITPLNIPDTEK